MSTDVLIDDFPYTVKIAQQRTVVLMLMPCWGEKANQIIDLSWATEYRNREWSRYYRFGISQTHFTLCSSLTFPSLVDRMKFSDSIMEMLGVCATTVHRVGLQTAPNELCPRVPLMAWITCAFTIQAIGTVRIGFVPLIPFYHFHFPNLFSCHGRKHTAGRGKTPLWVLAEQTGGKLQVKVCYKKHFCLSLHFWSNSPFQLAGLKAIVQFSAVQRLKCSQAVIQSHFSEMLAGVWMVEAIS